MISLLPLLLLHGLRNRKATIDSSPTMMVNAFAFAWCAVVLQVSLPFFRVPLHKSIFLPCLHALSPWRTSPQGRLAEIIVLDQFSRNVYRNTPQSFSQDQMALILAQEAVAANACDELNQWEKMFLLLPYMHSESAVIHETGLELMQQHSPVSVDFEIKHKVIIERFGRYPHRNEILGRESTAEEIEFLQGPDSSF